MRLNYTWTCSAKVSCRLVMDIMSYCGQKDISTWNLIIFCTPISDTTPYICFYWRTSRSSWHLFVRMWVVKQLLMRSLMFIESNHSMRHPLYWYLGEIWASDVQDGVDRGLGLRWLNGLWWLCDIRGNWNRLKWALSLRFEIPDHSLSDLGQISIRLMSIRRQVNTATIQLSIG